ncbi:hypothetical protein M378DRAFT_997146 [Amanita muscaria Koide BX008]|uniref:RBR-type E3 ubiquitin transferase n=1 Tax=Amanita muscaria (strain Koide BX008) TaxID=946122 RepID=A0A0C2WE96_AMAMK|nr:hypothetical protein M378DRAFT_997146 [Amanita muscaria Koide BX008]
MSTRPRTRPCREFSATGHCKFGEKCRFAHNTVQAEKTSSLEPSATLVQLGNRNTTLRNGTVTGNVPCRYFKAGRCTKGESCRWSHELEQDAQGSSSISTDEAGNINDKKDAGSDERNTKESRVRTKRGEQRGATEAELEVERQAREAQLLVERKMKQREIAEREASVTIRHVVMDGSMLVTCGAGLDIQHVVCGFDSCFITIKNLPRYVKRHEIEELITEQGVDATFFCIVKMRHVYVTNEVEAKVMSDSGYGQVIAADLDGMEFQDKVLDTTIDNGGAPNKMGTASERNVNVLAITWKLPTVTMEAHYMTADDAQNAIRRLNNTIFCGRKIRAELPRSTRFSAFNTSVRVWGLAPTVTTTELQNHSGAYRVDTKSTPSLFDNKDLERYLKLIVERKRGFESYEVSPPNPNKFIAEARVRFHTWDDAKRAQDSMEGQVLRVGYPQLRFSLPKPLQYVITIPLSQYRAQKGRWDSLPGEGDGNEGAFVRVTNNSTDKAFIRVLGEDKKAVGQLKVRVESLVAGETLDLMLWHRSFMGAAGIRCLEDISARTKTYLRGDWKSKTLKLYADGNAKQAVIDLVKAEIERLEGSEWPVSIHRRAIGFFMRKGLPILQEELGEDAATLELLPTPRLIIRGGEEARRTVDRLIDESRVGIESETRDSGQDACPICFDEVTTPVMLTCGHFYCTACLRHFLSSAVERKTFPLACSGDEDRCKAPIAIPIIQRYLLQQQFDRLVEMAVTTYIEKQPTKFRYCTTPDCPQVYRYEGGGMTTVLTCPSCFATVCTGCHKEAHEGMTCREREIMTNPKEQERLNEEWALAAGAKRCPSCRVWIQKTEGCNHMTCQCGVHLCWLCLMTFPAGQSVYTHMNSAHGGIYGDVDQRAPIVNGAAVQRPRMNGDGVVQRAQINGDGVQQRTRLAQEQADLAFARRLQAEENGVAGARERILGWQLRAQPEREPEWLGVFHNGVEEQRQRRAEQEARQRRVEQEALQRTREWQAREIRETEQRRAEQNERRGGWCIIM